MNNEAPKYNFVKVGNGRLALYHRPRRTDFNHLREIGCTHIVTLLKESEHAAQYGDMTKNAGLNWFWLPVPNGNYPMGDIHKRLIEAMPQLSQLLDEGNSLLIHCSAGVHRTGAVAYGLLRWRGIESNEAMRLIGEIRKETAEGMLEKRMRWGDENARPVIQKVSEKNIFSPQRHKAAKAQRKKTSWFRVFEALWLNFQKLSQQEKTWAHSVKEFANQLITKLFRSR